MRKGWVREATTELCIDVCGSRCCKANDGESEFVLQVSESEAALFPDADVATERVIAARDGSAIRMSGTFVLMGEQCDHLDGGGYCDIYDQRPMACRKFPEKPTMGCFVWPMTKIRLR